MPIEPFENGAPGSGVRATINAAVEAANALDGRVTAAATGPF